MRGKEDMQNRAEKGGPVFGRDQAAESLVAERERVIALCGRRRRAGRLYHGGQQAEREGDEGPRGG